MVNLLGKVDTLTGIVSKSFDTRTITSSPHYGQTVKVEVPTHVNGIMQFENSAVATITTTFDVYYDNSTSLEIYGTKGTLRVPDPNGFGGPVMLLRPEDGVFREIPLTFDYKENSRGLGVADMAKALREGRAMRAGSEQTLHVLDIMTAFEKCSQEGKVIKLESTYERKYVMSDDGIVGIL